MNIVVELHVFAHISGLQHLRPPGVDDQGPSESDQVGMTWIEKEFARSRDLISPQEVIGRQAPACFGECTWSPPT